MARIGPQGKIASTGLITVTSIFPTFVLVLDLNVIAGFGRAQKIRIVNLSNNRRLFVSYTSAGDTPHDVLDPRVNPGIVIDDEHPVDGVIRLAVEAGSIECYVTVSA